MSIKDSIKTDLKKRGYKIRKRLGSGGLNVAYLAEHEEYGECVIRRVTDDVLNKHADLDELHIIKELFDEEVRVAKRVRNSPSFITLKTHFYCGRVPVTVWDYAAKGTLQDLIDQGQIQSRNDSYKLLFLVARGLDYAHRLGIFHGDLKPENLFMFESNTVKIGDLGISVIRESATTRLGTRAIGSELYCLPADNKHLQRNRERDVFAFAVCYCVLRTGGIHPFGYSLEDCRENLRKSKPDQNVLDLLDSDEQELLLPLLQQNSADKLPESLETLLDALRQPINDHEDEEYEDSELEDDEYDKHVYTDTEFNDPAFTDTKQNTNYEDKERDAKENLGGLANVDLGGDVNDLLDDDDELWWDDAIGIDEDGNPVDLYESPFRLNQQKVDRGDVNDHLADDDSGEIALDDDDGDLIGAELDDSGEIELDFEAETNPETDESNSSTSTSYHFLSQIEAEYQQKESAWSVLRLLYALPFTIIYAASFGIAYAFLIAKLDFFWPLQFAPFLALGAAIAFLPRILYRFKLRQKHQIFGLSILSVFLALYFSYAFHPYFSSAFNLLFASGEEQGYLAWSIAWAPQQMQDWGDYLVRESGWGWVKPIRFFWTAEALFLFVFSIAATFGSSHPVCEKSNYLSKKCNLLGEKHEGLCLFTESSKDKLLEYIKGDDTRFRDIGLLWNTEPATEDSQNHIRVDLSLCKNGCDSYWVRCVTVKRGSASESSEFLLLNWREIERWDVKQLMLRGGIRQRSQYDSSRSTDSKNESEYGPRSSVLTLAIATIISLLVGAGGGILYSYNSPYSEFMLNKLGLLLFFCAIVGIITGASKSILGISNSKELSALSLLTPLIAFYFHWAFYPYFAEGHAIRFFYIPPEWAVGKWTYSNISWAAELLATVLLVVVFDLISWIVTSIVGDSIQSR